MTLSMFQSFITEYFYLLNLIGKKKVVLLLGLFSLDNYRWKIIEETLCNKKVELRNVQVLLVRLLMNILYLKK